MDTKDKELMKVLQSFETDLDNEFVKQLELTENGVCLKEIKLNELEKLYLKFSDCDGMCNHCKGKLKEICIKNKKL